MRNAIAIPSCKPGVRMKESVLVFCSHDDSETLLHICLKWEIINKIYLPKVRGIIKAEHNSLGANL